MSKSSNTEIDITETIHFLVRLKPSFLEYLFEKTIACSTHLSAEILSH